MIHTPTRSGTILLICLSLVAAMVAISFAYVMAMRTAAELGPSAKVLGLARQSAQAGTAHACEMLLRDYLIRPRSPTSDASAHRVFFDPIDNQSAKSPREAFSYSADEATLWNDNDVNPLSKNLNGYRNIGYNGGRVYFGDGEDLSWLDNLVASSTPRYIESMYFSTDPLIESTTKTDFTSVPGTLPNVNTPMYYDSRWQPTTNRSLARYRLRYGVWCEDLSGHVFMGLPAPFTRGDPLAVDGDLIATGRNNQGTELDRTWALRYAPQLNVMFLGFEQSAIDHNMRNRYGGTQGFLMSWLGSDTTQRETASIGGFSTAGVLLGSSPWVWRNTDSSPFHTPSRATLGTPWHPLTAVGEGNLSQRMTGKRYSFASLNEITGQPAMHLGALAVPYGAPTHWTSKPDWDTVDVDTLAYNEGPTDCPWRINILTAPANTLRAMFTGFRPSWSWEHQLNWRVKFPWVGIINGRPTWTTPPLPVVAITPPNPSAPDLPKRSQMNVPDPFRASFLTKSSKSVAGVAADLRPFAQFVPSPSADNPRAQMDPSYPSPITSSHRKNLEDIGRFSDLERAGTWFGRSGGEAGPCTPRPDIYLAHTYYPRRTDRMPIRHSITSYVRAADMTGLPMEPSVYKKVHGQEMEVDYSFDPGSTIKYPKDGQPTLWNAHSYLLDALSALASSAAVAIAVYQPDMTYPAEPSGGGDPMFAGKWNSGATLDSDIDGDGYKDANSVITNVADIDRLFLLILGEDPYAPGSNILTRSAVYASMPGGNNTLTPTAPYTTQPFIPRLVGLPAYAPGVRDYSTYFDTASGLELWAQNPFIHDNASKFINLRRASLLGLRRGIYTSAESGLHAANTAQHQADAVALQTEASSLVKGGGAYAADTKTQAKHRQLLRCRLRDAERLVNDMRMSFFGANVRYRDRTRTSHSSLGRFRPYDLDGDGWAICSAYCPSDVDQKAVIDLKDNKVGYRFSEPTNWNKVVFDTLPDNPNQIDGTNTLSSTTGSVWVCFQDVDLAASGAVLTNNTATSDFKDLLTYSSDDVVAFPGSAFGPVPASRSGFTRWFYPAVRVVSANNVDVIDGVAFYAPDTYFSLTGYMTMEKSHFYRMITRGEVWDEWRRLAMESVLLETVFMLDPDGNVLMKSATKPVPIDPTTNVVTDGSGLEDSSIIYQRWLTDLYSGSRNRSAASP